MVLRIVSSLVLLPLIAVLVYFGGIPLKIGILFASIVGMREFYLAFSKEFKYIQAIGYIAAVIYVCFLCEIINFNNYFNIFVSIFLILILVFTVVLHKKSSVLEGMITFFGFIYVCFLISHIFLVREYIYGQYFVWLIFICAWGCDTGAYLTGVAIGKHKLIPSLSPKKTIEGAVGGVVFATIIGLIYGLVVENYFVLEGVNTVLLCTIIGALGSVMAQFGDLAASAMKRYKGIKDFGNLIPGHGGIIDRFDSVLLTAPVVYYIMLFFIVIK